MRPPRRRRANYNEDTLRVFSVPRFCFLVFFLVHVIFHAANPRHAFISQSSGTSFPPGSDSLITARNRLSLANGPPGNTANVKRRRSARKSSACERTRLRPCVTICRAFRARLRVAGISGHGRRGPIGVGDGDVLPSGGEKLANEFSRSERSGGGGQLAFSWAGGSNGNAQEILNLHGCCRRVAFSVRVAAICFCWVPWTRRFFEPQGNRTRYFWAKFTSEGQVYDETRVGVFKRFLT